MKKSIAKNYFYNLSYQILVMLLPLITTPYISRVLGANSIGIYSYTLSISAFFILFGSLGVALYGQMQVAYCQKDNQKRSYIFWEIIILRVITMSIALIIYYLTFATGNNDYTIYYKILILEIIGNLIDISWFFQGLEEFKKTVVRNTIVKLISIILIFTLVKTKNDLPIYFYIYVFSILIGNLSLWFYLPKHIEKINIKKLRIKRHIKPTISFFIPQIAIQVYTILDKTMLGTIILDKAEVGYYEQAQKIVKMLLQVLSSFSTVMMPRVASTFSLGDKSKIKKYIYDSINFVYLVSFPMIFGIFTIIDKFVPIFFGPGYSKVALIIKVICPIILFMGMSNVTGSQYLLATKKQNEYTISVIIGAITNFILNILLIKKYGAIGASIGSIIAELNVILIQLFLIRKKFDIKKIISMSKNYFFASLIMFSVCYVMNNLLNDNILSIVVQIFVGAIIYSIILFLLKDQLLLKVIDKIKRKKQSKHEVI